MQTGTTIVGSPKGSPASHRGAFSIPTKDEAELFIKLDKMFSSALSHPTWVNWRQDAATCFRYKEGDQWTSAEKAELKLRHQPATVNNQIKVTLDRLVGQFVKQRTRIGYRGRNYPQDEPIANTLSDVYLFIKQNTNLEFEERDMAEDGFTSGFGVLETFVTFNDLLKPEIGIRNCDCLEILPDPFSRRYDWNEDANYIIRAKWVDTEEAKKLYPAKKKEIEGMIKETGAGFLGPLDQFKKDNYLDPKQRRIRLVEVWYKEKELKSILFIPDGEAIDLENMKKSDITKLKEEHPGAKQIDRIQVKMRVGIFCAGVIFEDKPSPHDHPYFPFIPYFVHRKKDGEPYSMIFTALSIQDAINKRESKAISLLTQNQAIFRQNAIADKSELADEMARPDGQIEIRGKYGEDFIIEKNIDLAQTQFSLHQEAKSDFRLVTGINPDALGEPSQVRSGIGIQRKQQMTDIVISSIFDNLRRTRILLAKVVLELVKQYWTEKMIFYVTDDLNASRAVTLNGNPDHQKAIKEGIYDVIVEDMPDTTTVQQEVFESLAQTLPQILPYGPGWASLLIQMSDLPKKDAILQQVQQMGQPKPDDPKFSVTLDWSKLTGPEKAVFAAKKLGLPELAQAEMQDQTPPAHVLAAQTTAATQQQKSQAENQRSQADLAKMQMDMQAKQGQNQADQMKAQADVQSRQMGLHHAAIKNQMDLQHLKDKHALEIQKALLEIEKTKAMATVGGDNVKRNNNQP